MTGPAEELICRRCRRPLAPGPVEVEYMGHTFKVELPQCPGCGQVYVSEELAEGRIKEVEMLLEDK